MGRHKKPVKYWKKDGYWYYKTETMKNYKSTGEKSKAMAEHIVTQLMQRDMAGKKNPLFKDYAEPYFDWNRCPHATRLRAEGKHISERYCHNERILLVKYVLDSPIGNKPIADIKRGDLLDFRTKLQADQISGNIINNIVKAIKVIFSEAVYREDIPYNPAEKLGNVKTNNKEAGVFTEQELKALFSDPDNNLLWHTPSDYICFLLAASTGMRSAEVLALKWENIHLEERYIHVCEAWKDDNHSIAGLPKNYKTRDVVIPKFVVFKLNEYRSITKYPGARDLVVCNDTGAPYTVWYWQKAFKMALCGIGISEEERLRRHLKPHSFRHTLNTLMREKGMNPDVIRLMLGWADANIQNNYTHFDVVRMLEQGNMVDAVFVEEDLVKALPEN